MDPLDLVNLAALMDRTSGNPQLKIGLIDGPVVTQHPDLTGGNFQEPIARHAFMGRLLLEFCQLEEAPPHQPFALVALY
jgi:hypothetical protein